MNVVVGKSNWFVAILLAVCLAAGCRGLGAGDKQTLAFEDKDLGETIDSLARVVVPETIVVEGFGLVGGLNGTGSSECPAQMRNYFTQYILKELSIESTLDVDKFIGSLDTVIVRTDGIIPEIASKDERFDVRVSPLPMDQTTSLEGGRLFNTDLKLPGTFGITTRTLADVSGAIYIDKLDTQAPELRTGYILGGGRVFDDHKINLLLNSPDFEVTSRIRNLINGRYGKDTAQAAVPGRIELTVPDTYKGRKQRFVSVVRAMYITGGQSIVEERINTFVSKLAAGRDMAASEVALEAIGNRSLGKLKVLLSLSNEEVRLRAARCMLYLGSSDGISTLRQIALDEKSSRRIEALEAISLSNRSQEAASLSRRLLKDDDFDIMLAAYKQLRKMNDIAITSEVIARDFYLEHIAQASHQAIYVSRSGPPRVVLFGSPMYCTRNIFVQSADGNITINAPSGQEYVTIMRKHPKRPDVIAQSTSTFDLSDIIRKLCEEPPKNEQEGGGLGVSYAELVTLLKQMCIKGAVKAKFHAGPLPKIG